MGACNGHRDGARLCADVSRIRETRPLGTRACPARGDDGVFGGGALYLRRGAVLQARYRDSGADGNVLRQAGRIYGRRALGGHLQHLFRTGRMDAVSDVQLGLYRLARGSAQREKAAGKARRALRLRRIRGGGVFGHNGGLDYPVRRRRILRDTLGRVNARRNARHSDILRFKRRFFVTAPQARGQAAGAAQNEIRGIR